MSAPSRATLALERLGIANSLLEAADLLADLAADDVETLLDEHYAAQNAATALRRYAETLTQNKALEAGVARIDEGAS